MPTLRTMLASSAAVLWTTSLVNHSVHFIVQFSELFFCGVLGCIVQTMRDLQSDDYLKGVYFYFEVCTYLPPFVFLAGP